MRNLVWMIFALALFATSASTQDKQLDIAATEYPPFYGAELEGNGFVTQIIRAALDRQGYAADISFLPWSRAYEGTQRGRHDALFTVWHRPEREEWFLFSDPLPANELVFFHPADRPLDSVDYADLKGKTIGVVRGYAPPPGFEEAGLTIAVGKDDEENLRKLHRGRIDLVLTDRIVAQHLLNTKLSAIADQLTFHATPVHTDIQYLVVSREVEEADAVLAAFNAGLAEITADGTLDRIITENGF